jgi:hypothetical protein
MLDTQLAKVKNERTTARARLFPMRIKTVQLGFLLFCASALAFVQANRASATPRHGASFAARSALLWGMGLQAADQKPQVQREAVKAPPAPQFQIETVQAPPAPQVIKLVPLKAQEPPDLVSKAVSSPASTPAASAPARPEPAANPSEAESPRVRQSNDDYAAWRNDYLRRLYENQLYESWIIFVLVILLVFVGIFFSWLQFQHAFLLKKVVRSSAASQVDPNAAAPSTPDELTFGKDGVVVKSAYLGVIILVISMAFFFLYLKYVYLIS